MAMYEAQNPKPFDMMQWIRNTYGNVEHATIIDSNLESWISVFRRARRVSYSVSSLRDRQRRNAAPWVS